MSEPSQAVNAEYSASTAPSVTISDVSSGALLRRSRVSNSQSTTTAISPAANGREGKGGPDAEPERPHQPKRHQRAGGKVEAVGEVDHLQHAEHQREAEREQGVGGAQEDAVDELLG